MGRGKGGGGLEVIVHVEHVGEQRLGGRVDLLHLVLHLNVLESEVLPRPGHPEEPGDPLEEDHSDLKVRRLNLTPTSLSTLPSLACSCECELSCGGS